MAPNSQPQTPDPVYAHAKLEKQREEDLKLDIAALLEKSNKEISAELGKLTSSLLKTENFAQDWALTNKQLEYAVQEVYWEYQEKHKLALENGKSATELAAITQKYKNKIYELKQSVLTTLRELDQLKDSGQYTEEAYAEVSRRISLTVELLKEEKYRDIFEILESVTVDKEKLFESFSKHFSQEIPEDIKNALWGTIILILTPAEQESFMHHHLKEKDFEQTKAFVNDSSLRGISWTIIERVISKKTERGDLTDKEKAYFYGEEDRYREQYKIVKDLILDKVEYLRSNSDHNPALRKMTLGGIGKMAIGVGAALGLVANALPAFFDQGKLINPIEGLKNYLNLYTAGYGGILYWIFHDRDPRYPKDKNTVRYKLFEDLKELHPQWGRFLLNKKDNYSQYRSLDRYLQAYKAKHKTELDPRNANLLDFLEFLEAQSKRNPHDGEIKDVLENALELRGSSPEIFRNIVWGIQTLRGPNKSLMPEEFVRMIEEGRDFRAPESKP